MVFIYFEFMKGLKLLGISLLIIALVSVGCGSGKKRKSNKKQKSKGKKEIVQQPHKDTATRTTSVDKPIKKVTKPNPQIEKVINTAQSYIGVPYRFGGTTRNGLDCSGLVMLSYQAINIKLPRNSKEMSEVGKPVKESELLPGDLVFFSKSYSTAISHTGLIIEASSQSAKFIHSSTSKGVRIDDLNSSYWHPLFKSARRIVY